MKYLLMFLITVFAFSCKESKVIAAPKNKSVNTVAELKPLGFPAGSKIIEESDGGGRLAGFYEWFIEVPGKFPCPTDKKFVKNKISSRKTILGIINVSQHLEIDIVNTVNHWAGGWELPSGGYTFSTVETKKGKTFISVKFLAP